MSSPERRLGRQDRVAHLQERRLGRRQSHPLGDQLLRVVRAGDRIGQLADQRGAQVPQRLGPDLAVGVLLRPLVHLAEVAEREAAVAGAADAPGTPLVVGADGTVERLEARRREHRVRVHADVHLAVGGRVDLQFLAVQQIERIPVAQALAERRAVRARQRTRAVSVRYQPVAQPVRVLVPDGRRVVAAVDVAQAERDRRRRRGVGLEQVQLHPRRLAVGRRRHIGVVEVVVVRAAAGPIGRPVVGLDPHVVAGLERTGGRVEADVGVLQVIVEDVGEIERGDAGVGAVVAPRVAVGRVPGAVRGLGQRLGPAHRGRRIELARVVVGRRPGLAEIGEGVIEVVLRDTAPDLLGGVRDVVVVDVRVRVRVRSQQLRRAAREPARSLQIDRHGRVVRPLRCEPRSALPGSSGTPSRSRRTWSGSGGRGSSPSAASTTAS